MEGKKFDKFMRELRNQVNDLAAAAQALAPLVAEHGGKQDAEYLGMLNRDLHQLTRTIYHLALCGEKNHAFSPKSIDVAGLCRDVCREVETVAELLGVGFSWKLDKESVISMADGQLLERIILNMLTNAFAAAGKGGRVSLRCGVSKKGEFKVTVSDSGEGLKPPQEDETPLLKTGEGLGLGLEAARRAAALHGGRLMLDSPKGAGVRAVLSLPIQKAQNGERVRQKKMPIDQSGGFSALLVEFSPLLSAGSYLPEDVE